MSNFRYLLWDIDGTVLDFLAAEKAALKSLFIKYGFGECTDEMIQRYSSINVKYWQALERNEMTKPQILTGRFREFFETEGIDSSFAEAFNNDYQIALGDTIVFCDDSYSLLSKYKDDYILIAVTNGTKEAQCKKLKESGLDKIFHYVFISEDTGYEKPNIEFFNAVFSKVKIKDPSQALIIGDSLTSDIQGGINAGIKTCWYNPRDKINNTAIHPDFIIKNLNEVDRVL